MPEPDHQGIVTASGAAAAAACRRRVDRRHHSLWSLVHYLYRNRRRGARRGADRERGYYVDIHDPVSMAVVLTVVMLCVADAFITLWLLQHGGKEINPIMDALIAHGPQIFFGVKFSITASCLLFLLMHRHFPVFRWLRGHHLLYSSLAVYVVLIGYEMTLIRSVFAAAA